jgi:putative restriction endonuclease
MDTFLRNLAFEWIAKQIQLFGDVLDYNLLKAGFIYNGERISFLGPQGIWKPKSFQYPLSISTIPEGPYADSFDDAGFLIYHYQGNNPDQWDNSSLRKND